MSGHIRSGRGKGTRSALWVVALCWLTIIFDGYDLIVYGAVVPSLLDHQSWGLSPAEAGRIGSWALVGMLVGALAVGTITDLVGRRKIMLACIAWFSAMMGLCAVAPTPESFGVLRFLAGLGLGGVMPTASALTIEYARPARRHVTYALMFSGYSIGGVLAAALALEIVPSAGWRAMFAIGLAPLVTVLPLAWLLLPESPSFLLARGRRDEAEALRRRYGVDAAPEAGGQPTGLQALRSLFGEGRVPATLLFWAATFLGLLLVYGLNTWLPQIMREAGYELGSALSFLLVLNAGAVVGTALAALVADRIGPKLVTVGSFLAAAATIYTLSARPSIGVIYVLLAIAGVGTIGTQILVNAYVGSFYPASARATGLGWSLGVGRLGAILGPTLGGILLESGLGVDVNFYVFAAAGLLGAVVIGLVPRRRGATARAAVAVPAPASSTR